MSNLKNSKGDKKASSFLELERTWFWICVKADLRYFNESLILAQDERWGVLNTCKSSEALKFDSSDEDFCDWAADGWVTRG